MKTTANNFQITSASNQIQKMKIKKAFKWTRVKANDSLKSVDRFGSEIREDQDKKPKTWWGGALAVLSYSAVLAYAIYSFVLFGTQWPIVKSSVSLTNVGQNSTYLDSSNFYYSLQAEDGSCLASTDLSYTGTGTTIVAPVMATVPSYTFSYSMTVNSITGGGTSSTSYSFNKITFRNILCSSPPSTTANRFQVTLSFLQTVSFDTSYGDIKPAYSWYTYSFFLNNDQLTTITVTIAPQTFYEFSKWPLISPKITKNYAARADSTNAWAYPNCGQSAGFDVQFYLSDQQEVVSITYDSTLLDVFGKIGGILSSLTAGFGIIYLIIYKRKTIFYYLTCRCCCCCCKKRSKNKVEIIKPDETDRISKSGGDADSPNRFGSPTRFESHKEA